MKNDKEQVKVSTILLYEMNIVANYIAEYIFRLQTALAKDIDEEFAKNEVNKALETIIKINNDTPKGMLPRVKMKSNSKKGEYEILEYDEEGNRL